MECSKKYMILFQTWSKNSFSEEKEEFDTEKEWKEHAKLIDEVYNNTNPSYDRFGDKKNYGYVVLDFQNEKILKWSKNERLYNVYKTTNKLVLKDTFFRKENEIPKNYKWDDGEYQGWLQYRWGDGKNAIGYIEPPKQKKETLIQPIEFENDDDFNNELLQDKYLKLETKEKINKLIDRW